MSRSFAEYVAVARNDAVTLILRKSCIYNKSSSIITEAKSDSEEQHYYLSSSTRSYINHEF